jgi:cation:H+ antiporter
MALIFWFYLVIFIISCLLLVRSGTWVVAGLVRIAKSLEWKEFVLSFILMAIVSSLPEFFVGISSAFHGKPELSFGNVIGSNIINLTLAVAIGVLLAKGLKTSGSLFRETSLYTVAIAFLPILLIIDGQLSRTDGLILIGVLLFYFRYLFKQQKKFSEVFSNKFKRNWQQFKLFLKDLVLLFGGTAVLLLSAEGIVWSTSYLAALLGIPLIIVGTLIVALGTNLPEIIFGIRSVAMGHKDMLLGSLMGSVITNSTLVLGATALISPLKISDFSLYLNGILFVVITAFLFFIFSKTNKEINQKEAVILLIIYVLFVCSQFVLG